MPKKSQLQEIIIVSNSKFTNRQYIETNSTSKKNQLQTTGDTLKQACWNGLLKEMLPELFINNSSSSQLFLWQMRECKNVFTLELAESPCDLEFLTSIDPYCFMELQHFN